MGKNQNAIGDIVGISDFLSSILTAKRLLFFIVMFFVVMAVLFFLQSFYRLRLLISASPIEKKKNNVGALFSALFEGFEKIMQNFAVLVPILAGIIAALILASGVLKLTIALNEFIEREKRIRELSIAIKYLEQSEKVLAVKVDSVSNGRTMLRLNYTAKNPEDDSIPSVEWKKEIVIQGVDIYFDCLVLNFTYSEITSGRQRNIAIPYRVFSNIVPAEQGVSLLDHMTDVAEEDGFGFIPSIYGERLKQILSDEQFAKDMGVRSANGSAPHRIVNTGDRFSIRIEQSGGVNIYE
ncbi:MAG: hypothetical protein LBG05_09755 [Treponema sp.]|jgi:hypothetical protein|nr:hypothetical protein [Treponema sp.]